MPTAIDITAAGDPQVQPRLRYVRRGIYDPRRQFKAEFRRRIFSACRQIGVNHFPIFPATNHLRVSVTFNVVRMNKDIDNLLKLILDVLHGAVYANDADVTILVAKKTQSNTGDEGAYTQLRVEKV